MKTFCGFIGWIAGMFLGFLVLNTIPILGFIFVIGGIPAGRYIGGLIEEDQQREREKQERVEIERQRIQKENERKLKLYQEAVTLAHKYPEATKYYFRKYWGINKSRISDYDITEDKVETLLENRFSYKTDELRLNEDLRKQEEEKREAERLAEIAKRNAEEQEKKALVNKVYDWDILPGGLHYNYLLDYYPTTCTFEADEFEWADRWTVWNFKNTPGKTSSANHMKTLDNVIPKISMVIKNTFGVNSMKYLTLVCIPASSKEKTVARYEEFSRRLCQQTGMNNAFNHMTVVSSSAEKKFGGNGISAANVDFDSEYFRGKYILLFDDIITKGESMMRFKMKMEELGATVVAGFSIGKTKHER